MFCAKRQGMIWFDAWDPTFRAALEQASIHSLKKSS